MKNFFNKQREIIALLVYAAIIAALVYLVILPLLGRINGIKEQIQQESMKQESVNLHIAELPKIQQQYETLQNSGDLMNVLLDKNKAVELIEKLEKLAEGVNCKITIAVQDTVQTTTVKKPTAKTAPADENSSVITLPSTDHLSLKIALSGDYNSVLRFVFLLEKFEYYVDITALQINKEEVAQSPPSLGMFGSANPTSTGEIEARVKNESNSGVTASLDTVFYTN